MSKVSEYVKKLKDIGKPEVWKATGAVNPMAIVCNDGYLNLEGTQISPEDALSLGRWIMDNYGEKEQSK